MVHCTSSSVAPPSPEQLDERDQRDLRRVTDAVELRLGGEQSRRSPTPYSTTDELVVAPRFDAVRPTEPVQRDVRRRRTPRRSNRAVVAGRRTRASPPRTRCRRGSRTVDTTCAASDSRACASSGMTRAGRATTTRAGRRRPGASGTDRCGRRPAASRARDRRRSPRSRRPPASGATAAPSGRRRLDRHGCRRYRGAIPQKMSVLDARGVVAVLAAPGAPARGCRARAAEPDAATPSAASVLRAQADEIAGRYFDALTRYETLDREIADTHAEVQVLAARARRARADARARSISAYRASSAQLPSIVDSADATRAARRLQLIDQVNGRTTARCTRDSAPRRRTSTHDGGRSKPIAPGRRTRSTSLQADGAAMDAKLALAQQREQAAIAAQQAAATTASDTPTHAEQPVADDTHAQHDRRALDAHRARHTARPRRRRHPTTRGRRARTRCTTTPSSPACAPRERWSLQRGEPRRPLPRRVPVPAVHVERDRQPRRPRATSSASPRTSRRRTTRTTSRGRSTSGRAWAPGAAAAPSARSRGRELVVDRAPAVPGRDRAVGPEQLAERLEHAGRRHLREARTAARSPCARRGRRPATRRAGRAGT